MAFNVFVAKRWGSFALLSVAPACVLVLVSVFYGIWIGLGFFFAVILICWLLATVLLKNPFTAMLEGKGILVIDINSTGVLTPFIVRLKNPYVSGRLKGESVKDVYDRDAVYQLDEPRKPEKFETIEADLKADGTLIITLSKDRFNRSRFQLFQYPVLFYNSQIKGMLTKDYLSEQEKESFSEHLLLNLNRKLEDLESQMRDFARYVVETTRPKAGGLLQKYWWVIVILVVIGIGIMAYVFGKPLLLGMIKGGTQAANSGAGATPSAPVVPP